MRARRTIVSDTGYTLMELLVVLAIMALFAAMAPALFSSARPGFEAEAAARFVVHDLAAARQMAIAHGGEERVVLDFAARRYEILPDGIHRALSKNLSLAYRGTGGEIDFFADGSSNGGAIVVGEGASRHGILVDWPSGRISLDD